jgi:hypothetical protein
MYVPSMRREFGGYKSPTFIVYVGDNDEPPFSNDRARMGFPHPASATGDKRDLSSETIHVFSPSSETRRIVSRCLARPDRSLLNSAAWKGNYCSMALDIAASDGYGSDTIRTVPRGDAGPYRRRCDRQRPKARSGAHPRTLASTPLLKRARSGR